MKLPIPILEWYTLTWGLLLQTPSGITNFNGIYPFYRAIYKCDNLLQIPPLGELFNCIYFRRTGLYRCIEPSNFRNIAQGNFIYISGNIYHLALCTGSNDIYSEHTAANDIYLSWIDQSIFQKISDLGGNRTISGKMQKLCNQ